MRRAFGKAAPLALMTALWVLVAGCSGPLSKREQGGLIGAGVGAGTGAIVGSTVGHAAVGALIGGPIGLIGGALIGDQLMVQHQKNQAELERLRRENARLRERGGQW